MGCCDDARCSRTGPVLRRLRRSAFWYDNDVPPEHRDYGKGNPYRVLLDPAPADGSES